MTQAQRGPQWHSGKHVWHLVTGCHVCVDSSPTSGYAENLSQYDRGCLTVRKTPHMNFDKSTSY